jgi:hypothetical protein
LALPSMSSSNPSLARTPATKKGVATITPRGSAQLATAGLDVRSPYLLVVVGALAALCLATLIRLVGVRGKWTSLTG